MTPLAYTHVDVFSGVPFSGNSLPVFTSAGGLTDRQMLGITQEMRHFEAIFLDHPDGDHVRARIFDLFGELPFAGHPLLGAAAVLHDASGSRTQSERTWWFELTSRTVSVATERSGSGYVGLLDQGPASFGRMIDARGPFSSAFGLREHDLDRELPMEVVSTGLRYLILPVKPDALTRARLHRDITDDLRAIEADYCVLLAEATLEIRHWNNDGILEDVATGSAAGTIGAYRLKHRRARSGEAFVLRQGRHLGRPSVIHVRPEGSPEEVANVSVGGSVSLVGRGTLDVLP